MCGVTCVCGACVALCACGGACVADIGRHRVALGEIATWGNSDSRTWGGITGRVGVTLPWHGGGASLQLLCDRLLGKGLNRIHSNAQPLNSALGNLDG